MSNATARAGSLCPEVSDASGNRLNKECETKHRVPGPDPRGSERDSGSLARGDRIAAHVHDMGKLRARLHVYGVHSTGV